MNYKPTNIVYELLLTYSFVSDVKSKLKLFERTKFGVLLCLPTATAKKRFHAQLLSMVLFLTGHYLRTKYV